MPDLDHRRKQLESRLQQLGVRLETIENSLDETPPKDFEDRASEREEDEVAGRCDVGQGSATAVAATDPTQPGPTRRTRSGPRRRALSR